MTEKDTWQSIGDVTAKIMAKLEEDQRRVFERDCEKDGVYSAQQPKLGAEDARV